MPARLQATIPVLASLNLQESVDFYTNRLGFKLLGLYDDYALVSRNGAEIHFWACEERHIAENTSCYVRANNTQALFEEFSSKGVSLKQPVVCEWGMKELYVIDPHGNLLKFGEPV